MYISVRFNCDRNNCNTMYPPLTYHVICISTWYLHNWFIQENENTNVSCQEISHPERLLEGMVLEGLASQNKFP